MKAAMIKAALARKYAEAEGFADGDVLVEYDLSEDTAEKLDLMAEDLAQASGVSFQTALNTILAHALREGLAIQNN